MFLNFRRLSLYAKNPTQPKKRTLFLKTSAGYILIVYSSILSRIKRLIYDFFKGNPFLGLEAGLEEVEDVDENLFLLSLITLGVVYPALKTLKAEIDCKHLAWWIRLPRFFFHVKIFH